MSDNNRERYEIDDETLAAQAIAAAGTEHGRRAASQLFERYQRAIYLWCFRYVRDHERALELAQEVMMATYQRLDSFQGRSKFSSWLFAITRNRCINEVRRVSLLVDPETDPDSLSATKENPETEYEYREGEGKLMELIETTLDPIEQQALWLRCNERMPIDEITAVLGITTSTGARGLLQTARRKLRAALEADPQS